MNESKDLNIASATVLAAIGVFFVAFATQARADLVIDPPDVSSVTVSTSPAIIASEPFVPPLAGRRLKMVSGFGMRKVLVDPADPATLKTEMHEGVDWAVPAGTPVLAARSGKVLFAGFSKMYASRADKTDQSRLVIVLHQDGKSSRYVHLNTLGVRPGEQVLAGDELGTTAESDEWKEPVLHFEIRQANGRAIDPLKLLTKPAAR